MRHREATVAFDQQCVVQATGDLGGRGTGRKKRNQQLGQSGAEQLR
jgi:hypothetical protein